MTIYNLAQINKKIRNNGVKNSKKNKNSLTQGGIVR